MRRENPARSPAHSTALSVLLLTLLTLTSACGAGDTAGSSGSAATTGGRSTVTTDQETRAPETTRAETPGEEARSGRRAWTSYAPARDGAVRRRAAESGEPGGALR